MKNFIYIIALFLVAGNLVSCVEDSAPEDAFSSASNLVAFMSSSENFGVKATGDEYERELNIMVTGPSVDGISGDVTATIEVNEQYTTAIAGTHYSLDNPTMTLSADKDYLGKFPVTILTDGITPPLAESPVLSLFVSSVDANGKVIGSTKTVDININYLCPSDLAGSYTTVIVRDGASVVYDGPEVIAELGDGIYRGASVGHWAPGGIGGTPGFTFYDVCNTISVPDQNLVDLYSNQVRQAGPSSVDPATGVITIHYGIYSTWESEYVATYTPN